ncbi:hypothetical protein [Streptomyces sp. NPDC001100]
MDEPHHRAWAGTSTSNSALLLMVLPLLSSALVPVGAMPGWYQQIAAHR